MEKVYKKINLLIIFITAFHLLVQLLFTPAFASAPLTKRIYINFNTNNFDYSQKEYVYSESSKSFVFKLDTQVTGEIKSFKLVVNNVDKSSLASLQGYTLDVKNLPGQIGNLYSQSPTNPGHHIYRLPSGKAWEHTGKYTPIMQFDADSSSYDVETFSQYPGQIPLQGYARNSPTMILYPEDLRYDGLKGIAPNWNGYGAGVTASYDPTPPSTFYKNKQDYLDGSKDTVNTGQVDESSIRIVGGFAKKGIFSNDVIPYDWGITSNGENYIKIFRKFDKGLLDGIDYYAVADPTGLPYGEDRNYLMEVQTEWSAITYYYSGYIDVTYQEIDNPDLTTIDIVPSLSCFKIGDTVNFKYQFRNIGPATSTPFKVEIRIDGVVLQTDDWTGAVNSIGLERTFSYKFTSSMEKSITVKLDSTNSLDENSEGNNIITKVFTPQSSCETQSTPEEVKGNFKIEKPKIKFSESNTITLFDVSVTGGNSCAYLLNTAVFSQDDKVYTATTNAQSFGFNGLPYPKGMGVGFVSVHVTLKTTCGTVKDLGTKSFEIYIDNSQANSPPVFTPGFVNRGSAGATQALVNVTVGTHLDLQIIHTPEMLPDKKATPYDPDGDAVMYTWDFDNTNADWVKSKYSDMGWWQYDERYSYFIPDKLGTFNIKVTATDYRGATMTKIATINVVPPNPVPVITLPPKVVEGRSFTPDISGAQSYSPFGYAITQYIWSNKQTMYPNAGQQVITLDVVDSNGLHALSPASTVLNVQPDLPPIIQAFVPPSGLRNNQVMIQDTSYSPDNDPILTHTDTLTCDSNNNGNFADDLPVTVVRDAAGNIFYTSTKVGKCKLSIFIQEAEGYKKSATNVFYFEILNDQPVASYAVAGQVQTPPLELPKSITANDFLQSNWKVNTLDGDSPPKAAWFKNSSGDLQTSYLYNNPRKFSGQMYPYLAPNPSTMVARAVEPLDFVKTFLGSDIAIGMDTAKTQWEIRQNGNLIRTVPLSRPGAANNPLSYSVTDSTLYLYNFSGYSSGSSECGGDGNRNYWYSFAIDRIYDSSYAGYSYEYCSSESPKGAWSSQFVPNSEINWVTTGGGYNIQRIQGGTTVWQKNETNLTTYYSSYYDPIIPLNSDMSKFAVFHVDTLDGKRHLKIRDAKTFSLLKDVIVVPSTASATIIGFYKDIILINYSNMVYAYNYDGTVMWSKSGIDVTSVISKDGYLVGTQGTLSITAGRELMTFSLQLVEINTGNLVSEAPFITEDTTNYYGYSHSPASFLTKILENGKILVSYGFSYNYDGSFYSTAFSKILEGSVYNTSLKESYQTYGQLYDSFASSQNAEYAYAITFKSGQPKVTIPQETAGFSFRIQNASNMYRVEHSRTSTNFLSYVNGVRTVIAGVNWPIVDDTAYNIKIKVNGTHIKVYMNGSLVFDKVDTTFIGAGSYGPYSVKGNVQFKAISVLTYPATAFLNNVVVVGQPITYNTSYSDPENDPAMLSRAKWTFTNQQPYMYLNNGDGYSEVSPSNSYNNALVTSPNPTLTKVGYYKVDYQIPDDPSPPGYSYEDGVYASYSQFSDPYTQLVKVVRVPVAQFSIQKNAKNTLSPIDTSYDPDRWLSTSNYQTGYGINRGIFDRKWKYTAPDGTVGYGFPTNPNQTGTYFVSLVVMQEDGIWSEWYEQSIDVVVAVPNNPPTATLTFPNGTQASPSYVNTTTPTITWNESDPDQGTIFASFHVIVKDVSGNVVVDSGIQPLGTTATSAQWKLNQSLAMGQQYQVQVAVNDGIVWSAWSNIGWLVTNRPPVASMTVPDGTQAAPTVFSTLKPVLKWNQTDPDPGTTFSYFQIQIMNEANTVVLVDSGQYWQGSTSSIGSWTPNQDLPTGQKLRVRVRVFDGGIWSDYSEQTWMIINRAPIADFDWNPKPVWEGDIVQSLNTSTDPDGDTLTYAWSVKAPDGSIRANTSLNISQKFIEPGDYTVSLTVSDGKLSSTVVKVIQALPLTIHSNVTYTEHWLTLHNGLGHQTQAAPKQFYSGEILVVASKSSSAPVDQVSAWIDTFGIDGHSLNISEKITAKTSDGTLFTGELFDNQFQSFTEGLPLGLQTVHFQIRYTNGVVKTEDIPIEIIGYVQQSVGVHRVQ